MSQSPNTASPMKSTESPNSSPLNATPITTIHPSFASALNPKPKKTTAKRPSTFKTPKSKKTKSSSSSVSKKTSKKKGSNSKSKSIHTMQELYLDNVAEKNVESYVEASVNPASNLNEEEGKSNLDAETLEFQKGVTSEDTTVLEVVGEIVQDSPEAEESLKNQVVEEALNSLKDTIPTSNVVPDVETPLAQEEPTPDIVGNNVNDQVVDEHVSDKLVGTAANGENLVSQNEENVVPQVDEAPVGDNVAAGNTTEILSTDNAMSENDDVVDVDAMTDLDQTISEVAGGSIARRLRNRKGKDADVVEEVVAKATPSKKKKMIGPSRKPSKVEIASEKKKKSGKRKQAEVGDSDYEVEEDVQHIASNIVSPAGKKSQKKFRRAALPVHDVVDDVPNIVSTGKKKIGGKIIPQNVPDVPMDNISFHFIESAQKWKFVANRRLALERELGAEALECKEIVSLIEKAGLLKTVSGIGECYEKLVKEFLVNIPEDCDNPLSKEHHKVYVRGKCVHFSPAIINKFLGNKEDGYAELEVTNNQVCKTITANQVKVWPLKGKVPSVMLSVKYVILNRIGTANWVPTTHTSDIATGLARFIYSVGTGTVFNYGAHIFDEIVQHAKSWAIRMPIAFPSLICSIILAQHPTILSADDEVSKRESPLDFHPKLFEGKHAADIVFAGTPNMDAAGPSLVSAGSASMSRKEMIASLEATCKALDEKKKSLEQVIVALRQEEAVEEGEHVQVGQEEGTNDDDGDTEELELSDSSADF
ncbi:hypothetical protein QL285_020359 [Trifolium repens]|nr:hypothetical protein QL285_020359 [Trifolium repens]